MRMAPRDRERRRFSRVQFHAPARLRIEGRQAAYAVEVIDLSMQGALVRLEEGAPPPAAVADTDDRVVLEISLSEADRIAMEAQPAHWHEADIGLRCQRIDLDSMMHLRSLLEANLADPDQVHRELTQLVRDN
ncbi:PilZ domain-containing protein [Halorhodospira neutriphila]|uniref:Cyclic diguanosine monophosphate-binding protein n=1 Tax=Halorhodospira neutriphila TaxID=168379 RepID=A0ABS1E4C6_9GAMM|nr:hypothetical protein [Halorhodospira neutriphila]